MTVKPLYPCHNISNFGELLVKIWFCYKFPESRHELFASNGYWTLLHKLRKMSHLSSLMKIALATIAVSLHWPVLPGWWRSVDFHRNSNCWDTDCIARLSANIVSLFWRSVGLAVRGIYIMRKHVFLLFSSFCPSKNLPSGAGLAARIHGMFSTKIRSGSFHLTSRPFLDCCFGFFSFTC